MVDVVSTDFSFDNVTKISKEDQFLSEFLSLSNVSLREADVIFKSAIAERDLLKYRKNAHKLRTILKMFNLKKFEDLMDYGKSIFETATETQLSDLSNDLSYNIGRILSCVECLERPVS